MLGLLAHLFACLPQAAGSWKFAINREGGEPTEAIHVKPAAAFARQGEVLSFLDVQARARFEAEAAIGYIPAASGETVWPFLETDGSHDGQLEPLRLRKRAWLAGDRLVVIVHCYSE